MSGTRGGVKVSIETGEDEISVSLCPSDSTSENRVNDTSSLESDKGDPTSCLRIRGELFLSPKACGLYILNIT